MKMVKSHLSLRFLSVLEHNHLLCSLGTCYSKNKDRHKMADIFRSSHGLEGGWVVGLLWKQGFKCCQDSFSIFSAVSPIILLRLNSNFFFVLTYNGRTWLLPTLLHSRDSPTDVAPNS